MTLTLSDIVNAIAGVIRKKYPSYGIFVSPTQQGARPPCFFIFFLPDSSTKPQIGSSFMREVGIDIVFVQDQNSLNANELSMEIVDYLDENMILIPYGSTYLRAHDREWEIEDEVHYQFKIKERIGLKEYDPILKHVDYSGGIK